MTTVTLPRHMVIQVVNHFNLQDFLYVHYVNGSADVRGYVRMSRADVNMSVFEPFAKIEVEASQFNSRYVHLRFSHTNKYWGRSSDPWGNIRATSDQPVEDISDPSCTLFLPSLRGDIQHLVHVSTGGTVQIGEFYNLYVDNGSGMTGYPPINFVNWDTLVRLPKHITFKGNNDMYLRGVRLEPANARGSPYHQFSGNDPNHVNTAYEVFMQQDGHVRIKSEFYDRFWRRSPNWIWGDSSDNSNGTTNRDTLFWPVKLGDNIIALRNAGNNRFCLNLTADRKTNCLNAGTDNTINEARLVVEELVLERSIYNVRYRMEDARIYDDEPYVAGSDTARNPNATASTLQLRIAYTITRSRTFNYSYSLTAGVSTTISAGVPFIAGGQIEISASATHEFGFGYTDEESFETEAIYTVTVPPRSFVRVNYVASQGKCSVPFSYVQTDRRSNNGALSPPTQNVDGVFEGVNSYNYHFEELPVEPL